MLNLLATARPATVHSSPHSASVACPLVQDGEPIGAKEMPRDTAHNRSEWPVPYTDTEAESANTENRAVADESPHFELPETRSASSSTLCDNDGSPDTAIADDKFHQLPRWTRQSKRRGLLSRCATTLLILLSIVIGISIYIWRREANLAAIWIPDEASRRFGEKPLPPPLNRTSITQYKLPLRTQGRYIVDGDDKRFKLHSVNWYGASDELFVPGGLDKQNRSVIAQTIRKLGFNTVRLPYADELVTANPVIDYPLVAANPDLAGLHALDVFEAVVAALTDAGIGIVINNHITSATWCCGANPCDSGWANDHLGMFCRVKQTEEEWMENWETVMDRFIGNPLVIGADLRNEVRGLWGTMPWDRWASAAERCGNRLLSMNPDWLVIVEGTESANDLSGARNRPVELDVANKLVYSAHVYSWSGWGSWAGRFAQRSYSSFSKTMRQNWAYLLEGEGIDVPVPVWVGELGASRQPSRGAARYWQNLWRFLREVDADFGYWAINPRQPHDNVTEMYSLVEDDWVTPVVDYRMMDMLELMRA